MVTRILYCKSERSKKRNESLKRLIEKGEGYYKYIYIFFGAIINCFEKNLLNEEIEILVMMWRCVNIFFCTHCLRKIF